MISEGKWEVKPVEQPGRREFWIGSPTGRNLIARITRNSIDDKEAESNAHLIAASKLLLAACKIGLEFSKASYLCTDKTCVTCPAKRERIEIIKQALAAAEPN